MTKEEKDLLAEEYYNGKPLHCYIDEGGYYFHEKEAIKRAYKEGLEHLEKELVKYKGMIEDMKADMCTTDNKDLCEYLIAILKKYGELI